MGWQIKVVEINNEYHKVIYDPQTNNVVVIVDILSDEFIQCIIEYHDKGINKSFKDGMMEGIKIMKQIK